jgi:hypothetical protein
MGPCLLPAPGFVVAWSGRYGGSMSAQVENINPEHPRSESVPPRLRGCAFDGQGVRNGRVSRHLLTGGWRGKSAMNAAFILLARRRRQARALPRAPVGLRGLTPAAASNRGPPCDRRLNVAQQPIAIAGSKGLPVFRTPKHSTNSLRIAATTICFGLRRPRDFNRATSATIAGLYRMADMAGM